MAGKSRRRLSIGLLRPIWGFLCLLVYVAIMAFWGAVQAGARILHMTETPRYLHSQPGKGRDLTVDEHNDLLEVVSRLREVPEDPTLDVPAFHDEKSLNNTFDRVLQLLDVLQLDHLLEAVIVKGNYIAFLGLRIYVVPSTDGAAPDRMFEVWRRDRDGWIRAGIFGTDVKAAEHIYLGFVRQRVSALK